MAFLRIAIGWAAVTLWFTGWTAAAQRLGQPPAESAPAFKTQFTASLVEALLLTLFAGLWFGSLGSGGAWLLFLVVGALIDVPPRLRNPVPDGIRWKESGLAVLRIMAGGVLLSFLL